MHVVKVHNVGPETMVQFVLALRDLLEIQQLLAVQTEIADSAANVVAAMLSGFHDTDDSLMTTSHHSSRMLSLY
jgi:hypothetical protein